MKLEILIESGSSKKLVDHPQKDGPETKYACGLLLIGSWASRLEQHKEFCKTHIGKYLLKLEK